MDKKPTFEMLTFDTPAAEALTGASGETQRDWRRRGFIRKFKGHARYDLIDICELWVLQTLSAAGFGPTRSSEFARSAAIYLAWQVLLLMPAYAGDHLDVAGYEGEGPWGGKAQWMAEQILFGKEQDELWVADYYGVWPDGSSMPFEGEIPITFADRYPSRRGAVIVLPLAQAARWLVETADGHAFVYVKIGGGDAA